MNAESVISDIKSALECHFDPRDHFVFIFGSRASGTNKPNSDWDIGVVSHTRIEPRRMLGARDALDGIRTLQTFDLVDVSLTAPGFRKNIMRHTIPLIGDKEKWTKKLCG